MGKKTFYVLFAVSIVALLVGVVALGSILAAPVVAPRAHRFTIIMGEGMVIGEVEGEDVEIGEYHRWEPEVLVVNKGGKVIIEVKNSRKHIHSFCPLLG